LKFFGSFPELAELFSCLFCVAASRLNSPRFSISFIDLETYYVKRVISGPSVAKLPLMASRPRELRTEVTVRASFALVAQNHPRAARLALNDSRSSQMVSLAHQLCELALNLFFISEFRTHFVSRPFLTKLHYRIRKPGQMLCAATHI